MVKVISYANANHVGLMNLQRSIQPGWEHRVIGQGQVWKGWITRMKAYQEACASLPENELVVLCDAYDVLCLLPSDGFQAVFDEFGKAIVIGAEEFCALNCHAPTKWWNSNELTSSRKYCNGGLMAGYAGELAQMWQWTVERNFDDDQVGIGKFTDEHPEKVHLDMESKLVFNDDRAEMLYTFNPVDRSIVMGNKIFKSFFIHFPGFNLFRSVPFFNLFQSKNMFTVGKNYALVGSVVNGEHHITAFPADKRGSVIGICAERGILIGFATLFLVVAVVLAISIRRKKRG